SVTAYTLGPMARGGWNQGPIIVGGGGGGGIPAMPSIPPDRVRLIVVLVAALLLIMTTYYQVEPNEVGVVQRLGRYVRKTDPGPHLKLPFGIETVTKVPVQSQLTMEFGFHTVRAGVKSEFGQTAEEVQAATMLTGDLNVAVVEWIVQYKITDP